MLQKYSIGKQECSQTGAIVDCTAALLWNPCGA